jgi:hypothetical protein
MVQKFEKRSQIRHQTILTVVKTKSSKIFRKKREKNSIKKWEKLSAKRKAGTFIFREKFNLVGREVKMAGTNLPQKVKARGRPLHSEQRHSRGPHPRFAWWSPTAANPPQTDCSPRE